MNEKYTDFNEQVALGEQLCVKLKQLYHPDTTWFECYRKVADKLTRLKRKARKFFVGVSEIEMLKTLRTFTPEDLKELIENDEREKRS